MENLPCEWVDETTKALSEERAEAVDYSY